MSVSKNYHLGLLWVLAASLLPLTACSRLGGSGDRLTVATPWVDEERRGIQIAFTRWMEAKHPERKAPASGWIYWVAIEREEDLAFLRNPSVPPFRRLGTSIDVVLGVSARRLAALQHVPGTHSVQAPSWFVTRRSPLGLASLAPPSKNAVPKGEHDAGAVKELADRDALTFDDPRHDSVALAWAKHKLEAKEWGEGYAQLVRDAGGGRRIGRRPGSALGAVGRGLALQTPASLATMAGVGTSLTFVAAVDGGEWLEGVSLVAGSRHSEVAGWFLDFLKERGEAQSPETRASDVSDELLADLLGATLVDSQNELWEAWQTLEQTGRPERPMLWMLQAPPWPPASITQLAEQDKTGTLIQTLAEEFAPDAHARAWLLRDWLGAPRLVNSEVLEQICAAADGRLVQEPRFRAWLRAEWTAWARQRYRRVARMARGWEP